MKKQKIYAAFFLIVGALSGCANLPPAISTEEVKTNGILARQASCEQFYFAFDKAANKEDVTDIQVTQVKDYPFLSLNRFLVSFKDELNSSEQKNYWLTQAVKLDRQKRKIEWLNFSSKAKAKIQKKHLRSLTFEQRLKSCSNELLLRLSDANIWNIIDRAQVKENYSINMRTLGLYPLTSIIVKNQKTKFNKSTREKFNKTLQQLRINGTLQRYVLDVNQAPLNRLIEDVVDKENPLGIPFISSTTLNELFNQYAPILEVDENGDFDQVGEMKIDDNGQPYVDTSNPLIYTLPSYTRFEGKTLLQLNYVFWFPGHPPQKNIDLYAGKIDGLIWRVTLDENLTPIIFDSVHNCGCYHQFYSTNSVKFKLNDALKEDEPPFLAQSQIKLKTETPWVLRISSVNHFIQRAYQDKKFDKNAKPYSMQSYHRLRSLTGRNRNQNLFGDDAIIASSKRLERFILWPMGISSTGAMRQWGHHATTLVGKRFFDEPYLMNKFFETTLFEKTKEPK